MHFFNFDFITAAVWQLIFAQMTFTIDREAKEGAATANQTQTCTFIRLLHWQKYICGLVLLSNQVSHIPSLEVLQYLTLLRHKIEK